MEREASRAMEELGRIDSTASPEEAVTALARAGHHVTGALGAARRLEGAQDSEPHDSEPEDSEIPQDSEPQNSGFPRGSAFLRDSPGTAADLLWLAEALRECAGHASAGSGSLGLREADAALVALALEPFGLGEDRASRLADEFAWGVHDATVRAALGGPGQASQERAVAFLLASALMESALPGSGFLAAGAVADGAFPRHLDP